MLNELTKQRANLEVLNPVADMPAKSHNFAERTGSLDGKRVGLYWNYKPGGNHALTAAGEAIQARFNGATFKLYPTVRPVPKNALEKISAECDVVIGSTADCGSCTSHLIHDLVEFEKVGLPAVAIVARGFEKDAEHSAAAFGLPGLPYAIVPYTLTSRTAEQAASDVQPVIDDLVRGLTVAPKAPKAEGGKVRASARSTGVDTEVFGGLNDLDAWEDMNKVFLDRGWGDGFPLVPPTREKVDAMLSTVDKSPREVLGRLAPGNGIVTVEKLAINSVMASCDPEHFPVVVTAIEAILQAPGSQFPMRTIAVSTGPHFPILLVNGPIVKKLGINSGGCTLGPGKPSRVNTVLGRAIRLIMMNVGHAYPGSGDMDTIGTPHKYSFCLAENEDASPWSAYHVEHGLRKDQSAVTVFGGLDVLHVRDYNTEADEHLNTWASAAANPIDRQFVTRLEVRNHHRLMLVAPDHARILAAEGYNKSGVRNYISAHAVTPIKWVNTELRNRPEAIAPEWRWSLKANQDQLVPAITDPHTIHMVVVGGVTGKSDFVRLFGEPTGVREITCAVAK